MRTTLQALRGLFLWGGRLIPRRGPVNMRACQNGLDDRAFASTATKPFSRAGQSASAPLSASCAAALRSWASAGSGGARVCMDTGSFAQMRRGAIAAPIALHTSNGWRPSQRECASVTDATTAVASIRLICSSARRKRTPTTRWPRVVSCAARNTAWRESHARASKRFYEPPESADRACALRESMALRRLPCAPFANGKTGNIYRGHAAPISWGLT